MSEDIRARLDEIKARADAATEGPWEHDSGGEISQHYIRPQPWQTVVSREVDCMAYCYGGSSKGIVRDEDAEFIAHARTDVDDMAAALTAVLDLHRPSETQVITGDCAGEECDHEDECPTEPFTFCLACNELAESINSYYSEDGMQHVQYPCPTARAITEKLGGDRG